MDLMGNRNMDKHAELWTSGFSELAKGIRYPLTYRELEK